MKRKVLFSVLCVALSIGFTGCGGNQIIASSQMGIQDEITQKEKGKDRRNDYDFGVISGKSFENKSFGVKVEGLNFVSYKDKYDTNLDGLEKFDLQDCKTPGDFFERGYDVTDIVLKYEDGSWISIAYSKTEDSIEDYVRYRRECRDWTEDDIVQIVGVDFFI